MKKIIVLVSIILLASCSFNSVNNRNQQINKSTNQQITLLNEFRQVHFAERVIYIEFVRGFSLSFREAREECNDACPESGALELALGLIGISRSDAASNALINLLGLRLDGDGAGERGCQILSQGSSFLIHLENLNASQIYNHCQATFKKLRRRELSDVSDVGVEQVCLSDDEINSIRDEYIQAIKSNTMCEE